MPVLILTARDALHDRVQGLAPKVPTTTWSNPLSCLSWWAARQMPSRGRHTRPARHTRDPGFQEVEDDGSGIAALKRARVLERFYRVPGTAVENNGLAWRLPTRLHGVHSAQLLLAPAGFREGVGWGLRVRLTLDASG